MTVLTGEAENKFSQHAGSRADENTTPTKRKNVDTRGMHTRDAIVYIGLQSLWMRTVLLDARPRGAFCTQVYYTSAAAAAGKSAASVRQLIDESTDGPVSLSRSRRYSNRRRCRPSAYHRADRPFSPVSSESQELSN